MFEGELVLNRKSEIRNIVHPDRRHGGNLSRSFQEKQMGLTERLRAGIHISILQLHFILMLPVFRPFFAPVHIVGGEILSFFVILTLDNGSADGIIIIKRAFGFAKGV